jgi:exopolyphosphatase/guanosine-5'-triphosphate,3'-diphosphate pyrophosphatase
MTSQPRRRRLTGGAARALRRAWKKPPSRGDVSTTVKAVAPGARIAVIDVGSNSVRLVVFEGAERAPDYFFNEKVSCGLGATIARTGRLDAEGRARALAVLSRFAALIERIGVTSVDAVATAAVRDAEDGGAFCDEVASRTGLALRVISGEEEARLSARGVLLAEPDTAGLVVDMGGASLEIASVAGGEVGPRVTLALGPQRLAGLEGAALLAAIDAEYARARQRLSGAGGSLTLVGGAWRAFAKIQMHRTAHPLQVLHGYRLDPEEAAAGAAWVARQAPEALRAIPGVSAGRAANAPTAGLVLSRLIASFQPEAVLISAFGLREGLYVEQLPKGVLAGDPLLDAAERLEARQARFPGFGQELETFVTPVMAGWDAAERRLAAAACRLNDVNWRAHPDYRALSCFETVTRANITGLDHAGRVFIGFALMNRYGGGRHSADVAEALTLLSPEARTKAKALGRALRLGAMLSASAPGMLAGARLDIGRHGVDLHLTPDLAPLSGFAVEKRLSALAAVLDRDKVRVTAG